MLSVKLDCRQHESSVGGLICGMWFTDTDTQDQRAASARGQLRNVRWTAPPWCCQTAATKRLQKLSSVLLVNWVSCEFVHFFHMWKTFFLFFKSSVKTGCQETFVDVTSNHVLTGELKAFWESRTGCYRKSPERTLRAGGNPSTRTWVSTFRCPICGWRNLCQPEYRQTD